jgi:steroid delta-isomerase-like uncharacterized protein
VPSSEPRPQAVTRIGRRWDERREAVLVRLLEAQNTHDVDTAVDCFEHPRYELLGNARVYDGPDEVRSWFATMYHIFPDLTMEIAALHHADDAVVAELWMSGTHLGSGPGDVEATGRGFRCRTAVIFTFAEDRLTGARVYYDTGTIARQLA